jgi:hypothetical protein
MKLRTKILNLTITILLTTSLTLINNVSAKDPAKIIAGWVENVRLENLDVKFKAKLDTGAKTSSIHAKNIKSFKKDGDDWLSFTLMLTDSDNNKHEIQMEKPEYRSTNIKNHDGNYDARHVIKLDMCFNGHVESTEFTLADRSEYIYDILLGRRFLKMFAIVDSKRIFLTTAECAKNS